MSRAHVAAPSTELFPMSGPDNVARRPRLNGSSVRAVVDHYRRDDCLGRDTTETVTILSRKRSWDWLCDAMESISHENERGNTSGAGERPVTAKGFSSVLLDTDNGFLTSHGIVSSSNLPKRVLLFGLVNCGCWMPNYGELVRGVPQPKGGTSHIHTLDGLEASWSLCLLPYNM